MSGGNTLEEFGGFFDQLNHVPVLYSFLSLITSTVVLWHNIDMLSDQFQTAFSDAKARFDYIVVGSGSAGSIVAHRLAEKFKVLLLEAGGEPNPMSSIPGLTFHLLDQPHLDWRYRTASQEDSCLAMNDKKCAWSRGKGLGGSSNLNFMMYTRGHPSDFNFWANSTGDPRWLYENLQEYFQKSENSTLRQNVESPSGQLQHPPPLYEGMAEQFLDAAKESGFSMNSKSDLSEGFFRTTYNQQENGKRLGTYQAFLQQELDINENLSVFKYAYVSRVLINERKEALGVEYERHGLKKFAFANKEIILSAGAIGTPKILMMSGIGPKAHLDALNITTLLDLPVGKNLQDHVGTIVGPFTMNNSIAMNFDRHINSASVYEFVRNGSGPLTSTGFQAMGFLRSSNIHGSAGSEKYDGPDIQLILLGSAVYDKMALDWERIFNFKEGTMKKYLKPMIPGLSSGKNDSFHILTILSQPRSRGEIRLRNLHPTVEPLILPNYFHNPLDIPILTEGIKEAIKLVEETATFKKLDGKLLNQPFPGCEQHIFRSDAYWECFVRHFTFTMSDPVGTCAMGSISSSGAVTDSHLRVFGTRKLRVVDASVMPRIVSGNTQAAVMMLGEIGSQMILEASAGAF